MKTFLFLSLLVMMPALALANGTIFGPDGQIYQQFDRPGGSTTFGSNGDIYQRFDRPGGSTTFGPNGQIWQEFRNPSQQPMQPRMRWMND